MEITSINFKDLNKYSKSTTNSVVRKPLIVRNSQILKPRKQEGVFILKKDLNLVKLLNKVYSRQNSSKNIGTDLVSEYYFPKVSHRTSQVGDTIRSKVSIKELSSEGINSALPKLMVYSGGHETIEVGDRLDRRGRERLKFSGKQLSILGATSSSFNKSKAKVKSMTSKEFSTILNPW
jgi:hypothetical protein